MVTRILLKKGVFISFAEGRWKDLGDKSYRV
jgi:hypothetical protein